MIVIFMNKYDSQYPFYDQVFCCKTLVDIDAFYKPNLIYISNMVSRNSALKIHYAKWIPRRRNI